MRAPVPAPRRTVSISDSPTLALRRLAYGSASNLAATGEIAVRQRVSANFGDVARCAPLRLAARQGVIAPEVEEQRAAAREFNHRNRGLKLRPLANAEGELPPGALFPPTATMLRTMPRVDLIELCQFYQIDEEGSAGALRQRLLCYLGCKD